MIAPKWVHCVDFRASSEPVRREPDDPYSIHFATRITDTGDRQFRATTTIFQPTDEDSEQPGLYVRLVHLVGFAGDPLGDDSNDAETESFVSASVMPAVFPYISEAVDSANRRVRPGTVMHLSFDYASGVNLTSTENV